MRETRERAMGALSGARSCHLPVRLRGIQLGRAVDVLLDAAEWRALGFEVRCGDETSRFLPYSTARVSDDAIAVNSALMLLEDIEFYRSRARSLRSLLGTEIEVDGQVAGTLRDLALDSNGAASE